jgi:mono/diheme cytochrome c family protein
MWNSMPVRSLVAVTVFILAAGAYGCTGKAGAAPEPAATHPTTPRVAYLKQWPCATEAECWAERREWYHKSEGAQLMPYSWFMSLTSDGRPLKDDAVRYGFIADGRSPWCEDAGGSSNPGDNCDVLPVGFARDEQQAATENTQVPLRLLGSYAEIGKRDKTAEHIGLTCAACHTSQLKYGNTLIRIDGGGGHGDIDLYTRRVLEALGQQKDHPGAFLGALPKNDGTSPQELGRALLAAARLKFQEDCYESDPEYVKTWQSGDDPKSTAVAPSFGRLDGFGRGANNVFGFAPPARKMEVCDQEAKKLNLPQAPDLGRRTTTVASLTLKERNPANAPVRIPAIWNSATYNRVQWSHSVQQPLARNVAQALGSYASADSVRFENLQWLERSLERLSAPSWPEDILPPIDGPRAAAGKIIFEQTCARCHAPGWDEPNRFGRQYRRLASMDVQTDLRYLYNFKAMNLGDAAKKDRSLSEALAAASTQVSNAFYARQRFEPEQRAAWEGFRENNWQEPDGYIARPLDGIWAQAPYLHNGSVISLDQLLQPSSARCEKFWAQPVPEFDPQAVGIAAARDSAGVCGVKSDVADQTLVDTRVYGNKNVGHEGSEFGTDLTPPQRAELLEYLKCIPRPDGSACPR